MAYKYIELFNLKIKIIKINIDIFNWSLCLRGLDIKFLFKKRVNVVKLKIIMNFENHPVSG